MKSTAVYDSLLRERGQEVAMSGRTDSKLENMAASLGRLMAIRKILPSWDH